MVNKISPAQGLESPHSGEAKSRHGAINLPTVGRHNQPSNYLFCLPFFLFTTTDIASILFLVRTV